MLQGWNIQTYRLFDLFLELCQDCVLKNDYRSKIVITIDHTENCHTIRSCYTWTYQPEWLAETTVVCRRPVSILAVHRSRARENSRSARDTVIVA